MSEAQSTVPPYLEGARKITWLQNTEKYGEPEYKRPFWFWPSSINSYNSKNECHPFKFGVGPEEILACAVWNDKEPGDFWYATSPAFMEDYRGPARANQALESDDSIIDIDELSPEELQDSEVEINRSIHAAERKAEAINRYNRMLYLLVGVTALGVGIRYYQSRQRT